MIDFRMLITLPIVCTLNMITSDNVHSITVDDQLDTLYQTCYIFIYKFLPMDSEND